MCCVNINSSYPILCRNESYLQLSEKLLQQFVEDFPKLYHEQYCNYNIHCSLHLVDEVRRFGPLDNFSAFRFENLIGKIKRFVKMGDKPL